MTNRSAIFASSFVLVFFLTGIFFLNMLSRLALAPLVPVLEIDLGISHAQSGSIFFFLAGGYSLGLLASASVSARISASRTIVLSALSSGLAFYLVAAADSLLGIRAGMFLLGMATGLYLPAGMTMLTLAVGRENWGKAIAVHEYAPTLAFISAPLLAELFLDIWGWPGIVILIGTASLSLGIVFFRLAPREDFRGETLNPGRIGEFIREPSFWIIALFFALAVGSTVGIYSMLSLYLVEARGIDRTLANQVLGLSRVPLLILVLVAGWLADRFGPKPMMGTVFFFSGTAIILLAVAPDSWVLPLLFVQPLLTVCFFPAGFVAISRLAPATSRSAYLSLAMFTANIAGGGLIPLALGYFADAGAFSAGLVTFGVVLFLGVLMVPLLELGEKS